MAGNGNKIPKDRSEAEELFLRYKDTDPLTEVPFALLNREQIFDYVCQTGMVFPFPTSLDEKELKVASYGIPFLGEIYEADDSGRPYKLTSIETGRPYVLRKNSIAFVQVETEFRLPKYIAARFNLQIKHVHRGLLLGTGPLIDPGFTGRPFIPLHNLTANDYVLLGGEGFIWFEFTKLEPMKAALDPKISPAKKTADQYFEKATGGFAPRSSILNALRQTEKNAELAAENASAARDRVEHLTRWGVVGGFIAFSSLLIGLAGVGINSCRLAASIKDQVNSVEAKVSSDERERDRKVEDLQTLVDSLRPRPGAQHGQTQGTLPREDLQPKPDESHPKNDPEPTAPLGPAEKGRRAREPRSR